MYCLQTIKYFRKHKNMSIFCKCQKVVKFEKWCILCIIYYRELDYTTGIFQSIGFKEFHEYLILPEEEKHSEKGKLLFEKGWQYIIHWNYNFVLIFHYCNTLFVMFSCARKGSFYKAEQIIQFFSIWLIKFGKKKFNDKHIFKKKLLNSMVTFSMMFDLGK